MKITSKYRIAAVVAAAVMGIAGSATSASADSQVAHVCKALDDGSGVNLGHVGVVCVDLVTDDLLGTPRVTGQAEFICQTTSGVEQQCADVILNSSGAVLSNAVGTRAASPSWTCGHSPTHPCSSTRNYVKFGSEFVDTSGCQNNLADNFWAVIFGGGYSIELPGSDTWVSSATSMSTGHYVICP